MHKNIGLSLEGTNFRIIIPVSENNNFCSLANGPEYLCCYFSS